MKKVIYILPIIFFSLVTYALSGGNQGQVYLPSVVTSSVPLAMPSSIGSPGQLLSTDGVSALSWTNAGAGSLTYVGTTSDLTGGPITGFGTIGLGTTGVAAGSYGGASYVGNFSADDKGRITSAGSTAIAIDGSQITSGTINPAWLNATTANTGGALVMRNPGGAFAAGTITATLNGTATNVTGTVAVANGGTGVSTANAGTFFAGPVSGSAAAPTFRSLTVPAFQKITSGSGTYNTPAGTLYLWVRIIGGGGGGYGTGSGTSGAAAGTASTFGVSLLIANGGGSGSGVVPGSGGSATANSPAIGIAYSGGGGSNVAINGTLANGNGGSGAGTPFIGRGGGGGLSGYAGGNGVANTGSGGGGGGSGATNEMGAGGAAGGYIDVLIPNPDTSYPYTIGTGGAGGSAGTGGYAGGNGAAGVLLIYAFTQ